MQPAEVCVWAESEYRQAAEYMVKLAGNEDYCRWIGKSAKQFIESKLGKGNTVDVLGQELDRVWMWINTKLEL